MTSFSLDRESGEKKQARRNREEADLQVTLMRDFGWLLPRDCFAFAVPNGGKRNVIEAANLKRQGVKAGVPDIILVYRGRAFGLELKSAKGKLTESQIQTFPMLTNAGMRIEVAHSYDEALRHIKAMGIALRTNEKRAA